MNLTPVRPRGLLFFFSKLSGIQGRGSPCGVDLGQAIMTLLIRDKFIGHLGWIVDIPLKTSTPGVGVGGGPAPGGHPWWGTGRSPES